MGFIIYWKKSEIVSSQFHFPRGTFSNSIFWLSSSPGGEFSQYKLLSLIDQPISVKEVSAGQFLQLIGFLISLMDISLLGRCLHILPIHWYLLEFLEPATKQWGAVLPILVRLFSLLQSQPV
jgi:hypothetical protein